MFSNSIEYALESCIVSFNEYLRKRQGYISYIDADLKNAFIQRYKLAIKSVPDSIILLTSSNLSKFTLENNCLVELEFSKVNRWNSIGQEYVDKLNSVVSKLNLRGLGKDTTHLACLEEFCSMNIDLITNYKI